MKKLIGIILAATMVLCLAVPMSAEPTLGVTTVITPASTSTTPLQVEQGQTLTLTATTTIANGNATFVSEGWTGAAVLTPASGTSLATFTSTAVFTTAGKAPGVYTVTYTIVLQRGQGQGIVSGSDSDEAYFEVIEQTQTIYIAPKAAPAIAAAILQFNAVKPSYKTGKTFGNFISDIAQTMGPQTLFNDIEKSIIVDDQEVSNPAYRQAVLDFLNAHSQMPVPLVMPPDSYFTD